MIRSTAFKGGLKSSLPIVAGYLPVGFAFGVAAESVQMGTLAAVFTSLFIYAGASQFALVGLLKDGVPISYCSVNYAWTEYQAFPLWSRLIMANRRVFLERTSGRGLWTDG